MTESALKRQAALQAKLEVAVTARGGRVVLFPSPASYTTCATINCGRGHTWPARIDNVLAGTWCPKCRVRWRAPIRVPGGRKCCAVLSSADRATALAWGDGSLSEGLRRILDAASKLPAAKLSAGVDIGERMTSSYYLGAASVEVALKLGDGEIGRGIRVAIATVREPLRASEKAMLESFLLGRTLHNGGVALELEEHASRYRLVQAANGQVSEWQATENAALYRLWIDNADELIPELAAAMRAKVMRERMAAMGDDSKNAVRGQRCVIA